MKRKIIAVIAILLTGVLSLAGCGQTDLKKIPAGSFAITSPAGAASGIDTLPNITWTAEPNADFYDLKISEDEQFESSKISATVRALNYQVTDALAYSVKYYVIVTAVRQSDGGNVALARKVSSFTTKERHDNGTPDYTASRVLYDFEEYEDTAALKKDFGTHVAGDPVDFSLAKNGGADSGKAMRIDYTVAGNGWCGIIAGDNGMLPAEKKVWSKTKGIRFWLKGDGRGAKLEVRFGKRGYQSWNAFVNINRDESMYISVPFSAFADNGGGDGIMDLSGISRLWFCLTDAAGTGTIYIDEISIGSDENYTADTRAAMERTDSAEVGAFDDFESYADMEAVAGKWTFEGDYAAKTLVETALGTQALSLTPSGGWANMQAELNRIDFSSIKSVRLSATAGDYTVQLIAPDWKVLEADFRVKPTGGGGINLADMQWRNGSAGDIKKMMGFSLGIRNSSGMAKVIDDIVFSDEIYVQPAYVAPVGVWEDFESYADVDELSSKWKTGMSVEFTDTFNGTQSLALTPGKSWESAEMNLYGMDFSGIRSISFAAMPGHYTVQLVAPALNVLEADLDVAKSKMSCGVNLADMKWRGDVKGDISEIEQLVIGIASSGNVMKVIDDLVFSDEDYVPPASDGNHMFDDFEGYNSADEFGSKWSINGPATPSLVTDGDNRSMKLDLGSGQAWIGANGLENIDLENSAGVRFGFKSNNSFAEIIVQIGYYGNVKQITRKTYAGAKNNVEEIVLFFEQMTGDNPAPLDKTKINFFRIYVTQWTASGVNLIIDDVQFFGAGYAPTRRVIDDFDGYADSAQLKSQWIAGAGSVSLEEGRMRVDTAAGISSVQFNFPGGDFGGEGDMQKYFAVEFDIEYTGTGSASFAFKLSRWSYSQGTSVSLVPGENKVRLYFTQLTDIPNGPWTDMLFNSMTVAFSDESGTGVCYIDNVVFLEG